MCNSFNRDHINTLSIDLQSYPIRIDQTALCNNLVKKIHSGFIAGKLENQNGSTNLARVIPMSYEQGVTL